MLDAVRDDHALPADISAEQQAMWTAQAPWLRSPLHHSPATVARKLGDVAVFIGQGARWLTTQMPAPGTGTGTGTAASRSTGPR